MKIGVMQPYFFPYLAYWQLINAVDKYVIYDDVNYIKRGWINRNRILFRNQPKYINVYLKGASQNKLIKDIEVNCEDNDKNLLILREAYKKAPYYSDIFPLVEEIISNREHNLAKYNGFCIKRICDYLSIKAELIYSSEINKDNNLTGQNKILSICKNLNGDTYINAEGGKELYSDKVFNDNGLDLLFLEMNDIDYKQYENEFIPRLSIIDVMMFNSVEKVKGLLNECVIKAPEEEI